MFISNKKDKDKLKQLTKTINHGREIADIILKASEELTSSSNALKNRNRELTDSIGEVNEAVENIAQVSSEQASDVNMISNSIGELGRVLEVNKRDTELLSTTMKELIDVNDEGVNSVNSLQRLSFDLNGAMKEVHDSITSTNDDSIAITEETSQIRGIASQINLLALNASIEASRAGVEGKGFAVIAEEIRKLAGETAVLVENIDKVSASLTENAENTVDEIKRIGDVITLQDQEILTFNSLFKEVFETTENLEEAIKSVINIGNMVEENKNSLDALIVRLSAVTENTSASTEEVSASLNTQHKAVSDTLTMNEIVNEVTERLKDKALEMRMLIDIDKVVEDIHTIGTKYINTGKLEELNSKYGFTDIAMCNSEGDIEQCNDESSIGVNLLEAAPIMKELYRGEDFTTTPIKKREEDGKKYKYLAVLRGDRIYQVSICVE